MQPFQNEAEALEVGDLKIENRMDRISIYGRIDVTRDKAGLENARVLKQLLDQVVAALEGDRSLPEHIAAPRAPVVKKNPFA